MTDYFKDCGKCGGSGEYISKKGHAWKCSACRGSGQNFKNAPAKKAYYAELAQKGDSFTAANPWLMGVALLVAFSSDRFAESLGFSVLRQAKKGKAPSAKQTAALFSAGLLVQVKLLAKSEPKTPVVTGTVEVVGKVLSTRSDKNPYAYDSYILKMLVLDDRGFKLWGTVPTALKFDGEGFQALENLVGSRVKFVANVSVSPNDESFGFFKRPRKATLTA